jgi:amino acid transporter
MIMRLLLALLVAAGLSLLIGLAVAEIASAMPCRGEGLVCNLDEAIGAYAVIAWSLLGPLVFGVILLVAGNRVTLLGGLIMLLAPLVLALLVIMVESWNALGFEPYRNLRRVLTMFLPPALAVVAQWQVLRLAVGRAAPRTGERHREAKSAEPPASIETLPPVPSE